MQQLDWDYEGEDKRSQNGSYRSKIERRRMTTSTPHKEQYRFVPSMGIPASLSRSNVRTPRTPINTPRKRTVSIRESNWRQGRSNIQNASDILARDIVDWRRVDGFVDKKDIVLKNVP